MDFKIAFLVILTMITAYMGYNSYIQETGQNPFSSLSLPSIDSVSSTGFFTKFFNKEYQNVNIEANLTFNKQNKIVINPRENIKMINITYETDRNIFNIDSLFFKTQQPVNILISDMKGETSIGNLVSLKGYTPHTIINNILFSNRNNLYYIKADNLSINTITLNGIPKIDFNLENVYGTIILTANGDSVLYTISGKTLEIDNYEGDLSYDGQLLKLKGKGNLKSTTIITPKKLVK